MQDTERPFIDIITGSIGILSLVITNQRGGLYEEFS
jgi:hypothetical protein